MRNQLILNLLALFAFAGVLFLTFRRLNTLRFRGAILMGVAATGLGFALANSLFFLGLPTIPGMAAGVVRLAHVLVFFLFFSILVMGRRAEETSGRNHVLAAIHAVTGEEAHPEGPYSLAGVQALIEKVGALLRFDAGCVLQAGKGNGLSPAVGWNLPRELVDEVAGPSGSSPLLGRVVGTGEALLVTRAGDFPDPMLRAFHQRGFSSVAILALTTRGECQGVVVLASRRPFHFTGEVADLLRFMGRHLGEVLLNNRLQGELREESKVLAQALESRKLFFSMISQDLREPLTAIRGTMVLLHQRMDRSAPDDQRQAVERAFTSAHKLERLIGDLLELARFDGGEVRLDFVPVDPVAELKAVAEEAREEAVRKGLVLDLALPLRLPPVEVDRARFHQVMRSLLGNAIRFTPPGGKVTLEAESEEDNLRVRVSDTGVGIPPEDLPKVFEMFFRRTPEGDRPSGPGLGLAVTREVIRLHGGSIEVESAPGKGSTFTITIPRVHLP